MTTAPLALRGLSVVLLLLIAGPGACLCGTAPTDGGPSNGVDGGGGGAELLVPAEARGCEVLVRETSGPVAVSFGAGTRGTTIREAPKVAIAATSDDGVEIALDGSFSLISGRCVDAAGADVGAVEAR